MLQDKNIENVIKNIPNGKSVGSAGVSGEMFKYGISGELVKTLNMIFSKMINYQVMPYLFNVGIIKPIVKNENEDPNDINNLRPITISDVLANIYEKLIIIEMDKKHTHNDKQFGFKKSSSCNHAVFTLREAILFNVHNKKKVHIALIDASKAFDKVNRVFLWDICIDLTEKMLLEIALLLSIMSYYEISCVYIENNGEYSIIIVTTKGVKQGGPLSPRLFAMYIEKAIEAVEAIKGGVWLGEMTVDILVYADDIVLLSNTLEGLNALLKVTEDFGKKWEIKFNPTKTVYMAFGGVHRNQIRPKFDGIDIQRVKSVKYLGVTINERLSNSEHLTKRKQGTMARLKEINDIFGSSNMHPQLKIFLYKSYARPILYYGFEAIRLNKTELKTIQTLESSIVKYQIGLRKQSKSTEILYAFDLEKSDLRIQKLKCSFYIRLLKNRYTSKVITAIENFCVSNDTQLSGKSVINEVKNILFDTNETADMITKCKEKIVNIIYKIKTMGEDAVVKKIRESLIKSNYLDEITQLTYITFAQVN